MQTTDNPIRTENDTWVRPVNRITPCVCPCCGVNHLRKLLWAGPLPARKFCAACHELAANDYASDPYVIGACTQDQQAE